MDERGYESPIPYTDRGGYTGPARGWLERRGDDVWLVVARGDGRAPLAYSPRYYLVARPYGSNLTPRPGVRTGDGKSWVTPPEPVFVDYVTGYAGKPVVMASCRVAEDDWLDNDVTDDDRVALKYLSIDPSTGDERGQVLAELCANGQAGFTISTSGSTAINTSEDLSLSAAGYTTIEADAIEVITHGGKTTIHGSGVTSAAIVDGVAVSFHTTLAAALTEVQAFIAAFGAPAVNVALTIALLNAGAWKSTHLEAE